MSETRDLDTTEIQRDCLDTRFPPRYAGEDSPRAVVPTSYGYIEGEGESAGQYFIGDAAGPSVYRPGQTVHNPVRDGVIEDWSAMERVLEHTIK